MNEYDRDQPGHTPQPDPYSQPAAQIPAAQHPAMPQQQPQIPGQPAQHPWRSHEPHFASPNPYTWQHPTHTADTSRPAPLGAGEGGGTPPGETARNEAPRGKRQRPWLMVGTAATLAAVLASGGTAAVLQNTQGDSGLTQVTSSGTTVAPASDGRADWQAVAETVRPSVVAISARSQAGQGAGSGVIIDAGSGYVLTNNHVVEGAQQLAVTLSDGRMYAAEIVGTDAATDLAVLQLQDAPDDLVEATLGTSGELAVGQDVMAVGNPLGLDSTVTTGIISALDRPVSTTDQSSRQMVVTNAIQIDAAINPGNSGGPLFDSAGHVIGITSSIATDGASSGSIGLGFAIPVDLAAGIADQLVTDGSAEHAYLGVTLSDETVSSGGVTRTGAAIEQVVEGTPAAQAGLQQGDVIVQIDDDAVGGASSLTGYVRTYGSGDSVTLTVVRDGQTETVDVTLAAREDAAA
ncbi:trypsin-like peptidase domain-containing protein [Ruania alkalisoli]|uniref:Trypsin-like peptidase domain-containing protein n=1 Tax=Ruania alkalisoli TaxID=2779775 RepID=A0A7M1STD4_9MICO|nr:trypsin-like peptidase domain-containing protein [Ruania alkalisoli]QOR70032.1 trypsin-like peptidase domain-containing protein [Ruania alkalisoli]